MKGKFVKGLGILSVAVWLSACGSDLEETIAIDEVSISASDIETESLKPEDEENIPEGEEESSAEVEVGIEPEGEIEAAYEDEVLDASEPALVSEQIAEPASEVSQEETEKTGELPTIQSAPDGKEENESLPVSESQPLMESAPETMPEPITEPAPEAVPEPVPEPASEAVPESVPEPAPEVVPEPMSHVCSWDAGRVTQPAACNAEGIFTYSCSCGQTRTESIAKTPHNYENENQVATCTTDGYERVKCSMCGDVQSENPLKATGHTLEERWFPVAPDCTSGGGMHWNDCIHCNYEETLPPGQPLGHLADEGTVLYPGTCTDASWIEHVCVRCGSDLPSTDGALDPDNHDWAVDEEGEYCAGCGITR